MLALALTTPFVALADSISFVDNFESYSVGSYNQPLSEWRAGEVNTPHALKIVSDANGRTGKTVLFEYRNTDVKSPYNTVKADLAGSHVGMGNEQWVSFDVNVGEMSAVGKKSPLFFQYHMGIERFPPPVTLTVAKDGATQIIQQKVNYYPTQTSSNKKTVTQKLINCSNDWVRVIMYTKFDSGNNGQVRTYVNGNLEFTYDGQLGVNTANTYPRIGLYQANDAKSLTDYAAVNKVKFDNFKMGSTMAEVQ